MKSLLVNFSVGSMFAAHCFCFFVVDVVVTCVRLFCLFVCLFVCVCVFLVSFLCSGNSTASNAFLPVLQFLVISFVCDLNLKKCHSYIGIKALYLSHHISVLHITY